MWAEKYVGLKYSDYNCAELVQLILKEQFSYDLSLPQMPKSAAFMHKSINNQKELYKKAELPEDGSIVIMRLNGRMSHIGLYCVGKNEDYIVHAMQSMGTTILTKVKQLKRMAITVMEYRSWQ